MCRRCAKEQKKRIEKYCKVYEFRNEPIECSVAIINWDTSIIDYLPDRIWRENLPKGSKEGIYQGVHADYTHPTQGPLPQDHRIKEYLAITEDIINNWTGTDNVMLCRNPLELEKDERPLILVSPTRLTKEKGGEMMYSLSRELERQEIPFIWFVLTTDEYLDNPIFKNKNVIWIRNRLDVGTYLSIADWVVLPSECEGDSYTIREALYRGIPIVARHLKYFDEYGIRDGKNALFIDEENIPDVAKRMRKKLKFSFEPIKDGYDEILIHSKSHYKKDREEKVKLRCTYFLGFDDIEEGRHIEEGEIITVDKYRAEELLRYKCFEVIK